jgi:group I intron endonuclease
VYSIVNTANGKLYIGSTHRLDRRIYEHRRQLRTGTHRNKHLQAAWNAHGEAWFAFKPLAFIADEGEMLDMEREMIRALQCADREHGYNISVEPSNNQLGLKRSPETRARIGAAKIGNKNRLGAVIPQEMRDRIAAKLTGRKASPETIAKLSAARRGVPKNPEWVAKIKASGAITRSLKQLRNNA